MTTLEGSHYHVCEGSPLSERSSRGKALSGLLITEPTPLLLATTHFSRPSIGSVGEEVERFHSVLNRIGILQPICVMAVPAWLTTYVVAQEPPVIVSVQIPISCLV